MNHEMVERLARAIAGWVFWALILPVVILSVAAYLALLWSMLRLLKWALNAI